MNEEMLDSWKKISHYLGREIRTCHRWEKELGLPVHRIDNKSFRSKVFAYKYEIDQWLKEKANHKEIKEESSFKNKWILRGFVAGLALLSTVAVILYFSHRIFSSSPPVTPSIAVIPFTNLNPSEYDEYFSEGITNSISNNLTVLSELKVIPALTVFKSKNTPIKPKQISQNLGADYVLKGNIKKVDDKFNLAVQLIRTKDDAKIWKAEFEEPLENLITIQDNICAKIVEILKPKMPQKFSSSFDYGDSRNYTAFDNYLKGNYILRRLNGENSDPWKLFCQGKYFWGKCTPDANELAINLFNQAIEIDSKFAIAYIGLAHCYSNYVNFNWNYDLKWLNKAEDLVEKAQTIRPDLPEYYNTLTEILLLKEFCFNLNTKKLAFELAQEGINKYPNHPQLNSIIGYCYYLRFGEEGNKADFDKALEYKEKSFLLNPYDLGNIVYAEFLMLDKQFERAINICSIIKNHDPSFMASFRLGIIYYHQGNLDESEKLFSQFETSLEFKMASLFYLGMIASQKGEIEKAQRIIQKIMLLGPQKYNFFEDQLRLASIYLGLGKRELGYKYLDSFFSKERTKKYKFIYQKYIDLDKNFENFRKEEKFLKIIKMEMNNG
jgi:TolB-like protein/TPR repeat protein